MRALPAYLVPWAWAQISLLGWIAPKTHGLDSPKIIHGLDSIVFELPSKDLAATPSGATKGPTISSEM
jgi:hypothetical protein